MRFFTAIVALLVCSCAIALPINPATVIDAHHAKLAAVGGVLNDAGGGLLSKVEPLADTLVKDIVTPNSGAGADLSTPNDGRPMRRKLPGARIGSFLTGLINVLIGVGIAALTKEFGPKG